MLFNEEKRMHERHDYPLQIEYVLERQRIGEPAHKGVTINISAAGLGAYVLNSLAVGERVIISTGLPVRKRIAEVRWIKEKNISFYSTGLKFV
ncbi:MAG TPA: PilZ domain-containing protein [Nitrospirota bacterium]